MSAELSNRRQDKHRVRHAVGLAPGLYQPVELPKITKEMKEKIARPKISKIDKDSLRFHGDRDKTWQRFFELPRKQQQSEGQEDHPMRPKTYNSKELLSVDTKIRKKSKIPVRIQTQTKPTKGGATCTDKKPETVQGSMPHRYKQIDDAIPGSYGTHRQIVHRRRDEPKKIPPLLFASEKERDFATSVPTVTKTASIFGSQTSDWPVLPYTRQKLRDTPTTALKVDPDETVLDRFNVTEGEQEMKSELRLILFGNSGSGKSMAANLIIGQNSYHDFARAESAARKSVRYENERFGHRMLIVEIPGFFDSVMEQEKIDKEIARCVGLTSPGPHVFVFVLDGFLLSKQEQTTLKNFAKIFGEEMYKCLIILFTHKDIMEYSGLSLDSNINKGSPLLKKLLQQCENRYIAFNNFANGEDANEQVNSFIKIVLDVRENNKGKSYTNDMYQESERVIRNQVKEKEYLLRHEYALRLNAIEDKYEILMAEEKLKQDKIVKKIYGQMKAINESEYKQEQDLEWMMELQDLQIMYNDIHQKEKSSKIGDQIIKLIEENKKQIDLNKEIQQEKDFSDLLLIESEEKLNQLLFRRDLLMSRNEQEYVQERSQFRENIRLQCQIEEIGFFKRLLNVVKKFVSDLDFSED